MKSFPAGFPFCEVARTACVSKECASGGCLLARGCVQHGLEPHRTRLVPVGLVVEVAAKEAGGAKAAERLLHAEARLAEIKVAEALAPKGRDAADPQPSRLGWECPRCGAVLAPHVDRCTCAPGAR